jgi:hypothetical protein
MLSLALEACLAEPRVMTDLARIFSFEPAIRGKVLMSTGADRDGEGVTDITLRGDERLIIELCPPLPLRRSC